MADPGSGAAVDLCRPLLLERVQRVVALRLYHLRRNEHEFHVRQCTIRGPRLFAHTRYRRDHRSDQRTYGDGQSGGSDYQDAAAGDRSLRAQGAESADGRDGGGL